MKESDLKAIFDTAKVHMLTPSSNVLHKVCSPGKDHRSQMNSNGTPKDSDIVI